MFLVIKSSAPGDECIRRLHGQLPHSANDGCVWPGAASLPGRRRETVPSAAPRAQVGASGCVMYPWLHYVLICAITQDTALRYLDLCFSRGSPASSPLVAHTPVARNCVKCSWKPQGSREGYTPDQWRNGPPKQVSALASYKHSAPILHVSTLRRYSLRPLHRYAPKRYSPATRHQEETRRCLWTG